jgi:hypothetical protein
MRHLLFPVGITRRPRSRCGSPHGERIGHTGRRRVIMATTLAATRMATVIMAGSRAWRLRLRLRLKARSYSLLGQGRDLDET